MQYVAYPYLPTVFVLRLNASISDLSYGTIAINFSICMFCIRHIKIYWWLDDIFHTKYYQGNTSQYVCSVLCKSTISF